MITDYLINVLMTLANPITLMFAVGFILTRWKVKAKDLKEALSWTTAGGFIVCVVFAFMATANTPKNVTFNKSAEAYQSQRIIEQEFEASAKGVQDLTKPIEQVEKYETPEFLQKD